MAVVRLVGWAFPIAAIITLLGVLRMVIGMVIRDDQFVGGLLAVAQALGGVWVAAIIGLPIAHRLSSAVPGRTDRPLPGRTFTRSQGRAFWILFPSILAATKYVEDRLTGQLTFSSVAATVLVTVVGTLVILGILRWLDAVTRRSIRP